ncbi:hypothetical protein [Xanthomonas albilineans]|uniref:Uncharacterized protein n=1 Tax=Xanthomonas albilineans (strain GPE PC73 / CFBP 7063) TaxID=380358 RepID=D2U878_XANAP|nr:hypothetical protein [Xanthomonas albilineans]CBA14780.1 hypothetical protein XALC_0235 [Xanthomonas albilineans GPE PC73]
MSRYLIWLVLNDGVSERVSERDIDASEEAGVIDRVLIPLMRGEQGRLGGRNSPYSVTGAVSGKRALARLWDEESPLADIGVCLHSRAAPCLWAELHADDCGGLADINQPADAPWCAVRCYAPEQVLPTWFDSWTKTLAMALVRRDGW